MHRRSRAGRYMLHLPVWMLVAMLVLLVFVPTFTCTQGEHPAEFCMCNHEFVACICLDEADDTLPCSQWELLTWKKESAAALVFARLLPLRHDHRQPAPGGGSLTPEHFRWAACHFQAGLYFCYCLLHCLALNSSLLIRWLLCSIASCFSELRLSLADPALPESRHTGCDASCKLLGMSMSVRHLWPCGCS
jgi:hypothetical protein